MERLKFSKAYDVSLSIELYDIRLNLPQPLVVMAHSCNALILEK